MFLSLAKGECARLRMPCSFHEGVARSEGAEDCFAASDAKPGGRVERKAAEVAVETNWRRGMRVAMSEAPLESRGDDTEVTGAGEGPADAAGNPKRKEPVFAQCGLQVEPAPETSHYKSKNEEWIRCGRLSGDGWRKEPAPGDRRRRACRRCCEGDSSRSA